MNDPSVHDVLAGSLDRHGRAVGTPDGDLGDVLRRVHRRRARRRSTAVIGSTLAVAAGAAGIMLVAAPADAPAPGDGDPDAAATAASWGCSGFLSSDGTADYYAACEAFPFVVTPTMPVLPPATSVGAMMVVLATTAPSAITVSPASTTTTTTTMPIGEDQHVVVEGDSISGIAARYGVTTGDLVAFNGWADGIEHPLQIGDTVAVPYLIPTFPPASTAVSFAASSPPVCESGLAGARVTVPCDSSQLPTTTTTTTTTTMPLSAPGTAFRCNGPLGSDLAYTYYSSCEPVTWDAVPDPVVPTTAVFTPAFATTMPSATTITPSALTAPPVPAATCSTTTTVAGDISESEQTYTVTEGDYVSGIAELYGISVCALVNYNAWPEGLEHPLFPGDIVKIPPGSSVP